MGATTKLRSKYPLAFKQCLPEAIQYGRCVVQSVDLKVNECEKEFKNLSQCFRESIKSMPKKTPMSQSYVNSQAGGQEQQQQQQQQEPANSGASGSMTEQEQQTDEQQAGDNFKQQQTMNMMIGSSGEQMSQMTSLLLEFAFSAFVNKPQDIVEYAAQYFTQLSGQQQQQQQQQQQHQHGEEDLNQEQEEGQQISSANSKRASSDSQRSNLSQSSFDINNNVVHVTNFAQFSQASEDEGSEALDQVGSGGGPGTRQVNFSSTTQGQPRTSYNRRKSVFAEAYDPAADQEDDENSRIVHGKTDEQRQRLARSIKSIFLFRSVDPQDMTQILDAMFEVRVSPGDVVIRQGDDGDNFYVVERGKFQIYCQNEDGTRQVRGEYEDNGSFGELALMYNQPRAATVVALSEGSLWAMDRRTFRRIVLKSAFKKRKEYEALFEKVSVLQCLNGYERMNLCDALESSSFDNDQRIIVQGDQANGMYFIESGNVKIVKQMKDGRVIDVAVLGKGDYFGELALINHKPRAASVYAMGDDVKLAFLDTKAFERLLGSCIERMEKNCAMYLSELAHQEGRQNV